MQEDPPFRPNIPCIEIKPEYIDLMVDCWNDDPEERPHFYRIVERLKKISGRYNFSLIVFEAHDRDVGFPTPKYGVYTLLLGSCKLNIAINPWDYTEITHETLYQLQDKSALAMHYYESIAREHATLVYLRNGARILTN